MNNKIVLVTSPDDLSTHGVRLCLVNLNQEQLNLLTQVLTEIDVDQSVIAYIWNPKDPYEWFIDKKLKSDVILFNALAPSPVLNGYLVAHPNCYYFGTLREVTHLYNKEITSPIQLSSIISRATERVSQVD